MIRFSILFLLICSASFAGLAQQPSRIYVFDSASRIPLEDVLAELRGGSRASSGGDGTIRMPLAGPNDNLSFSRIGYQSRSVTASSLPNVNGTLQVALQPTITSLEEIRVSTGTGNVFKVISDLDIHLRPVTNSQEVLRMVPGLFIGQHAGGGKSEQIFLRGFDIDHGTDIRLTVDGMPVNMVSHAHGQGYADLHFLIPEMIDRVAFNKGPYDAEKGNFATAGYVDFKTKNFLQKNFVKAEGGSFNTFRTVAGINLLPQRNSPRTQSLFAAGEASFTRGYFVSPQDFKRFNGLLKYHGVLTPATSLTAQVTGFSSNWDASGQIPERAVRSGLIDYYGAIDDTEGGETSRYNVSAETATGLSNGGTITNQVFYSKYDFLLYSNFTFFKEDPINGDQIRQKESRNILGYNGTFRSAVSGSRFSTQTVGGVQVRYDDVRDLELSRTVAKHTTTEELKNGSVKELNAGAFAAQTLSLTRNLFATVGARADVFNNAYNDRLDQSNTSSQSFLFSPKLNFDYRPGSNIHLYWYNGRGFHSNDSRVVAQEGRRALPPAYGTDLGGVFKLGSKTVVQAALWYLFLEQEFVYVGDEGVVEAGGRTSRKGFDFSVRVEPIDRLFVDADISVAQPKALDVRKTENYLPLAPRFTSTGGLTYKKEQGLNGSLRYRFMGDRPANEDYSVEARGYFITDAVVNFTKPGWEAGITVQNLFNTRWKETQFNTESRLKDEPEPLTEIHFTPGTPFALRASLSFFF